VSFFFIEGTRTIKGEGRNGLEKLGRREKRLLKIGRRDSQHGNGEERISSF